MASNNYRHQLVGVFGDPVDENPTIAMFEAAFKARDLHWRYQNFRVTSEGLADAMRGMRAMNFRGINLTIPHKVAVLQHLDKATSEAALIGAVNTVVREGDDLIGTNTDGKGFLTALKHDVGIDPRGKRVVFLGAGGAARAMSVELALADASHITIANRTVPHGEDLARLLSERTPAQAEFTWWLGDYAIPPEAEIVVNATPVGLYPHIDAKPGVVMESIHPGMLVCDVIPNPPRTHFLIEAAGRGARTLDGLGMLVYQGAIAFTLWTGQDPPIDVMKQALVDIFA
jgi:shikimate dehydrogenase